MKLTYFILGLLLFGLVDNTVLAENIKTIKPVECVTPEVAAKELKEVGETPLFNDDNQLTDKNSTIVLMRNELTGTWTLLEFQQGLACILGYGIQTKI